MENLVGFVTIHGNTNTPTPVTVLWWNVVVSVGRFSVDRCCESVHVQVTWTSRKASCSVVNLMLGVVGSCACETIASCPCGQMMKVSSAHQSQRQGWSGAACKVVYFRYSMCRLAITGERRILWLHL